MEFAHGRRRREGYNFCEIIDDEQDDPSKHWGAQPSSSATSAAAAEAPSSSSAPVEKEHMFDKVVTPSDVGKLNRLVIPKQHAEKYFPLDTTTHEKGLLLNFEDRTGKPWRFRYSYWNSSQSYVMTKGWSRFVKEKRLDAGDTVSFGRGADHKDRLFIDWKRRPEIQETPWSAMMPRIPLPLPPSNYPMVSFATRPVGPWAGRLLVPPAAVYDGHRQSYLYNAAGGGSISGAGSGQYLIFRSPVAPPPNAAVQQFGSGGFGGEQYARLGSPMVLDSVPVVQSQAAAKRVRLFGVNLDCPDTSDGDAGDCSIRSAAFSSSSSPSPKGKEKEELSLDLDM